jgi:hypothetical protein
MRICLYCSTTEDKTPFVKGKNKCKICDGKISSEYHKRKRIEVDTDNPTPCKECGNLLSKLQVKHDGKFCSMGCAAKSNNRGVTRWSIPHFCSVCGVAVKKNRKFCLPCREATKTKFEDYVNDEPRKKILIEERGHKCEGCGLDTWLNQKIVLTMDHIDGNSDNSKRENLRLLCWNCHALTPTFGAKNIGKHPESKRNKKIRESIQRKTNVVRVAG